MQAAPPLAGAIASLRECRLVSGRSGVTKARVFRQAAFQRFYPRGSPPAAQAEPARSFRSTGDLLLLAVFARLPHGCYDAV
ncbi:hypothetical protein GCM10007874_72990 [Labrys miyagiensis]|uniref:Uncharacterized protein n=1 Tax=Labrys miyagiensis TaxID=346912 RepID=A0ABQ6CXE2_9HYPH|nr:hypothetical protein GCM10007874_72990 [Labrys miyagiensis]